MPRARNTFDEDVDIEAPEADVLDQHRSARREAEDQPPDRDTPPFEADDADAAEQDLDTGDFDDEDDYRD